MQFWLHRKVNTKICNAVNESRKDFFVLYLVAKLSIKEGIELAKECIQAAIERDAASGNGIDVFSITKEGIKHEIAEDLQPTFVKRQ